VIPSRQVSDELPLAFQDHWGELESVVSVAELSGGELKDVYRIEAAGGAYALRVYAGDTSPEDVASELALASPFAEQLPEVPAPLSTTDGESLAVEGGRVAVLASFIEGRRPDCSQAEERRAAAELLARVHAVSAGIASPQQRAAVPAYADLDWHANRWWSWGDIERFLEEGEREELAGSNAAGLHRRLIGEMSVLADALDQLAKSDLPTMPIHGDFFPGNLLWNDGRIAGLIDWDECAVDWHALEVANASIEFSRSDGGRVAPVRGDPEPVRGFLRDYIAAGGEILDRERLALGRLRRLRLLWETLYELGRACRGAALDYVYLWANLTSLDDAPDDIYLENS
jgi:Ser/Thr protein kinase RdoA (MazF antagonist)